MFGPLQEKWIAKPREMVGVLHEVQRRPRPFAPPLLRHLRPRDEDALVALQSPLEARVAPP